jgi:hypothetical protein
MVISHLLRQLHGQGDILGLFTLVAAAEQDDQKAPALDILDPVSGAVVNTKLADAFAERLDVTGIAERQSAHPTGDPALARTSCKPESHSEKIPVSRTSIICKP